MKPFLSRIFLSLPFLLFLGVACTGSSDKNASAPPGNVSPGSETSSPPPANKEGLSETQTRLEEYARVIQQPTETVTAAWNQYSAANHLTSLSDLDLSSEEALRSFIGDFIFKTDLSLNTVGTKIFGSNQTMIKFQAAYLDYTSGTAGGGTDGERVRPTGFFSDLQDLKTATGDFGRMLANDLNTLFPNRFTFTANLSECNNSPCNDFVQRSVTFLNNNVRERTLREVDTATNVSSLDSFTAFFKSVFNNLTFSVGDKSYTFYNFKTGEARLAVLPQEYAFAGLAPPPVPPNSANLAIGTNSPTLLDNSNTAVGTDSSQATPTQWQWTAPTTNWEWTAPSTNWEWHATDTSTNSNPGSGHGTDPPHTGGGTGDSGRVGGTGHSYLGGGTDGQP